MKPILCAVILMSFAACGSDDDTCNVDEQSGCDDGLVCELTVDGEPVCASPIVLRGQVFDLSDGAAIEGARVVALDVNRSPVSSVAITDADGSYDLVVPSVRMEDDQFVGVDVTLRADAAGYQTFPEGVRQALPIDTAAAVAGDDGFIVETALTSIGLLALPDGAGTATIAGDIEAPGTGYGVLVVAEAGEGHSAVADRDGDYAIFNVPAGDYTVSAFSRGSNYGSVDVSVGAGELAEADLLLSDAPASTLNGSVQIVNGGGGTATSIVLVVASTFDPVLVRGAAPPGLRAPEPGIAPDVTGAFAIEGVPAGTYKVLASFENDLLVRDPDSCIAGTAIVEQTVATGEDITLDQSFKVTGALEMLSPGAAGPEQVSGNPTISWVDDSSEDGYEVTVFDAFGEIVWEHAEPGASGSNPSVVYAGDALEPGMYYQVRVTSWRQTGGGGGVCEISQTEDLKGVFFIP